VVLGPSLAALQPQLDRTHPGSPNLGRQPADALGVAGVTGSTATVTSLVQVLLLPVYTVIYITG